MPAIAPHAHNASITAGYVRTGAFDELIAPDGTIEAVRVAEAPGFAIGVQWHPEWLLDDPLSGGVVRAFAGAAAHRAQARL